MSKMSALITILPSKVKDGTRTERCSTSDGVVHVGASCIHKAARHLITEGNPVTRRVQVIRDGKVVLTGTVGSFAEVTWGGDSKDPILVPWRPFSGDVLPPRLAAWHARVTARRAAGR